MSYFNEIKSHLTTCVIEALDSAEPVFLNLRR
jgi:hypothetical protein